MSTFYAENHTVEGAAEWVYRRFVDPQVTNELKEWANEQLEPIAADLVLVREGDAGYQDFLLSYIGEQVDALRADTVEKSPVDEVRDRPICTCDYQGCKLKEGRLPHTVREAESIDEGIREFKQRHAGAPLVLDDAAREWRQKKARVHTQLTFIQSHCRPHNEKGGPTEPPEDATSPLEEVEALTDE